MGKAVGVAKTSEVLGDEEVFPNPVYSLDDHSVQVGFLGKNGYWAIGEQEPWCETCVSVSEELGENGAKIVITETYGPNRTTTVTTEVTDENGNTTVTVETITEGIDGTPGPTGSVND